MTIITFRANENFYIKGWSLTLNAIVFTLRVIFRVAT